MALRASEARIAELTVQLVTANAQRDASEKKLEDAIKLFSEKYDEMKKIIYTVKAARNE